MQELDVPVKIETRLGDIFATHLAHNYVYSETGREKAITSVLHYCDSKGRALKEKSSVTMNEADVNSIAALTPANIRAKHEELASIVVSTQRAALEAQKTELEAKLVDIDTQLQQP